jgi:septum formation protein
MSAATGTTPLVLASASPRRLELLVRLGLSAEVVPADVDESRTDGEAAEAYVERVAASKAHVVAGLRPRAVVLAADTAVVLDGVPLGKPADPDDALVMLTRLSGRVHEVLTAVTVIDGNGSVRAGTAATSVTMAASTRAELQWYVGTGEPLDKAGSYGLQGAGAALVERIDGDPTTVIGLPLRLSVQLLRAAGVRWPG